MKQGWWKVRFDVTLDGIGIDFDELSAQSKKKIQAMLAQGCVAGEIVEDDEAGDSYGGSGFSGCEELED